MLPPKKTLQNVLCFFFIDAENISLISFLVKQIRNVHISMATNYKYNGMLHTQYTVLIWGMRASHQATSLLMRLDRVQTECHFDFP